MLRVEESGRLTGLINCGFLESDARSSIKRVTQCRKKLEQKWLDQKLLDQKKLDQNLRD